MANTIANPTGGFQEFGRTEGDSPTGGMTPVWIASTDAGLMFRGDPIITSSSPGTNNSGNYITSLQLTSPASGFLVRGVFQGVEQFIPSVGRVVWSNFYNGSVTGSTGDVKAWVIDDPARLFLVQASTAGTILSSFIGLNANFTTATTSLGNTTTGLSNVTLSALSSQIGSLNTLPFRIVDFYSAYAPPAVVAIGANAFINGTDNTTPANMVIVRLNNCDRASLTARSS